MASDTINALDLEWLCECMLETNHDESDMNSSDCNPWDDRSTLVLTETIVQEILSLQPAAAGEDPSFVPHEEFLETCRNFAWNYEAFLQVTRQNTVFDTLDLEIESPRCAPIYDALCSLLPNLHTLDLLFSSSAPSIVTTARLIAIASPKIRTLKLHMSHTSDAEVAEVQLDNTTVATFRSALEACTNLESLTWHMKTPRELLEGTMFPQLKELSFNCDDHVRFFDLEDATRMMLRHSSTLASLSLMSVQYRGANDLTILNQALGSLKGLSSLRLHSMTRSERTVAIEASSYTDLAATIAQLPNLTESLNLEGCNFPYVFYEKLGESLFHNKPPHRIEELYLQLWCRDKRWEDSCRTIVRAIRDGSSCKEHSVVRSLYFDLSNPDGPFCGRELVGDIFTLVTCNSIERLGLNNVPRLLDKPAMLSIIVNALGRSTTTCLRSLRLDLHKRNRLSQQEFLDMIHAIAGNKDTRLEWLYVSVKPNYETRMAVWAAIQHMSTLKALHGIWRIGKRKMPKSEIDALSRNYYLQNIDGFSPHPSSKRLKVILHLNKAGRRYLVDDTLSVAAKFQKGVEVLIQVKEHLDCLFYHLRENPSLCCNNPQQDSVLDSNKPRTGPLSLETRHHEETYSSRKRKQIE